ncbi:dihydroxy-acid dehydratase [Actibacterium mucosum]|uniref:dihydroxy-acid dehydratase n=1 Tax=Actibacterium mucosum TaxID=1087332 RepID=UPI001F008F63|nr:dihydroxy-acid dehydratase [Actibacterium mucosum]
MRNRLVEYGDKDFALFLRKAFIRAAGYGDESLERPIVGIVDTGSAFNPCHGNMDNLIEATKRGILLGGAIPAVFPSMSIHESFAAPTSMFLRNLMAMAVEESIRSQPMDAVILIGGCDKTVPALLMGAASAGVPAICLVTGPMQAGSWRGTRVGACTDCRRFWAQYRSEKLSKDEIEDAGRALVPTVGTCGVMGTASTMALAVEAMGMMLPGSSTAPAVTAERLRVAEATGARAAELALNPLLPEQIMTPEAFENAFRVVMAAGGSTNALIHLVAIAGRLGIEISNDTINRLGTETPVLVDVKPAGANFMEDMHRAGGLLPLLHELSSQLNRDCVTITGRSLGEEMEAGPDSWPQNIVRPFNAPLQPPGGLVVLKGNLAPNGAVMKPAAASAHFLRHSGRAVVFDGLADLSARIDDPDLDVEADDILVLKNAGPVGGGGMPEAGYLPIPRKLARQGVTDMVRLSDARMSGTAFGTIVLHVAPEAAVGGPLAAVRSGDVIELDVAARSLNLQLSQEEIAARLAECPASAPPNDRGYARLFRETVTQADLGCDLDFARPEMTRSL